MDGISFLPSFSCLSGFFDKTAGIKIFRSAPIALNPAYSV